eukprot:jgi/Chlat1/3584/Chrsp234S03569
MDSNGNSHSGSGSATPDSAGKIGDKVVVPSPPSSFVTRSALAMLRPFHRAHSSLPSSAGPSSPNSTNPTRKRDNININIKISSTVMLIHGVVFVGKKSKASHSGKRHRVDLPCAAVSAGDSGRTLAVDDGRRVYHLRAHSRACRDEWMAALLASKKYYEDLTRLGYAQPGSGSGQNNNAMLCSSSSMTSSMQPPLRQGSDLNTVFYDALGELEDPLPTPLPDDDELARSTSIRRQLLTTELQQLQERLAALEPSVATLVDLHTGVDGTRGKGVRTNIREIVALALNVIHTEDAAVAARIAARDATIAKARTTIANLQRNQSAAAADLAAVVTAAQISPTPHGMSRQASVDIRAVLEGLSAPSVDGDCAVPISPPLPSAILTALPMTRTRLPELRGEQPRPSIWAIIKDNIGKDWSRITFPRAAEDVEYCHLLDEAASPACTDPHERIMRVAAFAVSFYSSNDNRLNKPFNPILGETYSLKAGSLRFIAEQVSHHPPVSAAHASGKGWTYTSTVWVKNAFWGKSLELIPKGTCRVHLEAWGEHYTWQKVTSCVHNIVMGTMWLEHYGEMLVTNHETGDKCIMKLHKAGFSGGKLARVTGTVLPGRNGAIARRMTGRWDDVIDVIDICDPTTSTASSTTSTLWRRAPPPECPRARKNRMTQYSVGLNAPVKPDDPNTHPPPAPTDCRYRPDLRALDDGNYERATREKARVEDKQRTARKSRDKEREKGGAGGECNHSSYKPHWFARGSSEAGGDGDWVYAGGYWEALESPEGFAGMDLPDLY